MLARCRRPSPDAAHILRLVELRLADGREPVAIAQAVDLLNKYKRHDALELNIKMGDVLCTLPTPRATPETPSSSRNALGTLCCRIRTRSSLDPEVVDVRLS